jgi:flagellar biosynthetic protein FliR
MIGIPLHSLIVGFMAISVRLTGLMLFAPFFGSMAVPPRIKACIVLGVSVLLYPVVSPLLEGVQISSWPAVIAHELLIGAALGVATNLAFDAVQMAGQVLSVQMGFSMANIMDPQSQVDSTVIAVFHQTLTMLVFLRLNVHLWLIGAVGRSFTVLPPGTTRLSEAFTFEILRAAGQVFVLGMQMAAPVFSATVIADVVLALLGRASPQAPLMLLGTPIKTMLGVGILFCALKYWPAVLERIFENSMQLSDRLLLLAH